MATAPARRRREATRQDRHARAALPHARDEPLEEGPGCEGADNEGYTARSGDRLVREDLCAEAIRLGRYLG